MNKFYIMLFYVLWQLISIQSTLLKNVNVYLNHFMLNVMLLKILVVLSN